jgi:hypothetical protein
MNKLKIKILTIGLQLFGGKMLTDIRKFLAGKKTYLMYTGAIITILLAWSAGQMTTPEAIAAIFAALGLTAHKAGNTREIKEK